MHDFVPAGILILALALMALVFGWFVKPVFDAQVRNGCENINLAAVNSDEYVRWCNNPENFK